MTATKVPAELPISEARAVLTDIATAAKEHYAQTVLTKHGKPVAKVVHIDAGVMPSPEVWERADRVFHAAMTHPSKDTHREAVLVLGALLRTYNGHDQEAPDGR